MNDTYIFDAIRTPVGKFRGALSRLRTDDLAALVIRELLKRNESVDPGLIDDVIMGCANQAGEDNRNVARMALLLAGLPFTIPGETVNRLCASGMSALIHAKQAIAAGNGDLFMAGGVENMTRGPWVISKSAKPFGNDARMHDSSFGWRFVNPKLERRCGAESMGATTENLVDIHKISRMDQDIFAWRSQMRATNAAASGRLAEEIVPVEVPQGKTESTVVDKDEFIRPDTSLEVLAGLPPVFRTGGTVTAGNSSGLNDGAGVLLAGSQKAAARFKLEPKVRVVSSAVVGVEPRIMGIGPVSASRKALNRAGLRLDQMDIIELNEAFAAQVLACTRQWGLDDDDERINPNGGAIALGHPIGMSGQRILQTAMVELQKQKKRYALVTMCVGVGQGYATVLERV